MQAIIIGSDHAGFSLKEKVKEFIENKGFSVEDAGCYDENSVHYPRIAQDLSERVSRGEFEKGILICGTGIGMSITANRFENVRATLCHDHFTAKMSRMHNNSNVLCMGARVIGQDVAMEMVETWLDTEFEGGRHQTRLSMIDEK